MTMMTHWLVGLKVMTVESITITICEGWGGVGGVNGRSGDGACAEMQDVNGRPYVLGRPSLPRMPAAFVEPWWAEPPLPSDQVSGIVQRCH
jgi:hypothetical protein